MPLDSLITNPGRLRILTSLATEPSQEFVQLRSRTHLTDGNLSTHARRLHNAGLLDIQKSFREGKPVTTITLTPDGRRALESHVQNLMSVLNFSIPTSQTETIPVPAARDEEWVD
jgi:DNA-binding MarR family transcriptional regulator